MNKKKRVLVMLLAIVTMLMVVGNVAFADHVVERWKECGTKPDSEDPAGGGIYECCYYVRLCRDINDSSTCYVREEECY
ncbi:hypothetical protein [Dethiothermospora halolimnae]|uniref:hypothetical protein n=1 Tax=Dethiothermospora halolimnae TaxID=3114390 RepID=UPI003CCC3D9C